MTHFMKEYFNSFDDIQFFHTFLSISRDMKIVTLNEIHRYVQNFMLYKMIYFSSHKFAFSNLRFSPFYGLVGREKMSKILEIFWKNFFEIWENFFEDCCTTVYKAGFSKVGHLNNVVTKIITKYPVLTPFKILKIIIKNISIFLKKLEMFFFIILRILKVVRTGYFVIIFLPDCSNVQLC